MGVTRIRDPTTEDTDDEDEGKEEYEQDSDTYQDEEDEEARAGTGPDNDGHLGTQNAAADRPTSYHRTNTMTSTNSRDSQGRFSDGRPAVRRRITRRDSRYSSGAQEADETGYSSSSPHQPSWRMSSGHKLGPHSISVHRHSTVLRHGGSEDGEEIVIQGGWGSGSAIKRHGDGSGTTGGSTIKGKRSQGEDEPLLSVNEASTAASGSGSRQTYGTLQDAPSHLQGSVLSAKKDGELLSSRTEKAETSDKRKGTRKCRLIDIRLIQSHSSSQISSMIFPSQTESQS